MNEPKRYRKKPVEIEAMQLDPQNAFAVLDEVGGELEMTDYGTPTALLIPTLEGIMRAEIGDYIIRGVEGEYYPCKPKIFEKTYEEVTE